MSDGFFDYNNRNRNQWDDFNEDEDTRLDGGYGQPPQQQGGYPPPQQGGSFFDNPQYGNYEHADAPTMLPNQGGYSGGGAPYDGGAMDETRLPDHMANRPGIYDEVDEPTMLGPEDEEINPIAFLVVKRPLIHRGHVYTLKDTETTIGRKRGNLILMDRRVSGMHARIRLTEDPQTGEPVYIIVDLDARTGTFINSDTQRLEGRQILQNGDEIKMGDHIFVFLTLLD